MAITLIALGAINTFDGALDWIEKTSAVIDLGKVVVHAPAAVSTYVVTKAVHQFVHTKVKAHCKARRAREHQARKRHLEDRGHKNSRSSLLLLSLGASKNAIVIPIPIAI